MHLISQSAFAIFVKANKLKAFISELTFLVIFTFLPFISFGQNAFEGSGLETDPYKISKAEDLIKMSELVNKGDEDYNSKYFVMTNDIDMSSVEIFTCKVEVWNGNHDTVTKIWRVSPTKKSDGSFVCNSGAEQIVEKVKYGN